ncbi:hypothetical protein BT69DRAFT_55263 [Atractiella rhizophila]|nr:hypothetical protein BT69DRAFT_55263 [Atractiella rhizophila]
MNNSAMRTTSETHVGDVQSPFQATFPAMPPPPLQASSQFEALLQSATNTPPDPSTSQVQQPLAPIGQNFDQLSAIDPSLLDVFGFSTPNVNPIINAGPIDGLANVTPSNFFGGFSSAQLSAFHPESLPNAIFDFDSWDSLFEQQPILTGQQQPGRNGHSV